MLLTLGQLLRHPEFGAVVGRTSLAIMFGWLGAMRFTPDAAESVVPWLQQNRLLPNVIADSFGVFITVAIGVLSVGAALLLIVGPRWPAGLRIGTYTAAAVSGLALTTLLTNPVWIDDLGGFPAIGSGQGIIKYLAPLGIALFVLGHYTQSDETRRRACHVMVAGLLLPLVWIGGMKFTGAEAAGVEPLLATSPFFSWMLTAFSRQGASNVLGLTEMAISVLLASWWFRPAWFRSGALLTVGTFLSTLSFLVTFPGWHESLGFPALNGAGIFLIKDICLLGAAVILLGESMRTLAREPTTAIPTQEPLNGASGDAAEE